MIPSLEEADRNRLEGPITAREKVIQNMKTGKASGLDWFLSDFCKTFAPKLIPLICRVYNEIFERKTASNSVTGFDLCTP